MITQVHGPEFFRWGRLAPRPRNFGKKKSYSCTDFLKIIHIELRYANKYSRVKETGGEVREMVG